MRIKPGMLFAAVIAYGADLYGRDLEFQDAGRKFRGPIQLAEIFRDVKTREILGVLIRLHWSVESPAGSNEWLDHEDTHRRDFMFSREDLDRELEFGEDGTIICRFPRQLATFKPKGDNLDRGKVPKKKRY
ncbi:MAG: hypothetical protein WC802_04360 [Patescibacteria group bacterium]